MCEIPARPPLSLAPVSPSCAKSVSTPPALGSLQQAYPNLLLKLFHFGQNWLLKSAARVTLGDMCLVVHPFALSLRVWLHNSFPNSKTSRRGSYLLQSYLHPRAAAANAVSVVAKVSHTNNKQKRNVLCFSVLCFPWQLHGRSGSSTANHAMAGPCSRPSGTT